MVAAVAERGTSGGTGQTTASARPQNAMGINPFVRATRDHSELVSDLAFTLTTGTQNLPGGVIPINAYGYFRGLLVTVVISGGVAGTAFQEDGPWSILQNISLSEPNGNPIHIWNTGWELMASQMHSGFLGYNNPKRGIFTTTMPNGQFQLYIPLELNQRDGLGALPNQNAAAAFQLRYQIAGSGLVYTTTPTTQPAVQVTVEMVAYDQPQAMVDGQPNMTTPPAMNTTQFFSVQQYPVVVGFNRIRLTRVGNYIRSLGFVFRAPTTRTTGDTNFPTSVELDIDARPIETIRKLTWRNRMYHRYGYDATTLDGAGDQQLLGTFWYDFCHEFDGIVGHENRDGWLRTYGSTRLELVGTFGAAGTLTVITNDVAVASNVFMGGSAA